MPEVYLVEGGALRHISTESVFQSHRFWYGGQADIWHRVAVISDAEYDCYVVGSPISSPASPLLVGCADGTYYARGDTGRRWRIARPVGGPAYDAMVRSWGFLPSERSSSDASACSYAIAPELLLIREGTLIKEATPADVYFVTGGSRALPIESWPVLEALGYEMDDILIIPDGSLGEMVARVDRDSLITAAIVSECGGVGGGVDFEIASCGVEACNGVDDDCDNIVDEGCPTPDPCPEPGMYECGGGCTGCLEDPDFPALCWPTSGECPDWCCREASACRADGTCGCPADAPFECRGGCWYCDDPGFVGCCVPGEPWFCCPAGTVCQVGRQCCYPSVERCNGNDDDCDGEVDEGVRNACGGCVVLDNPPGMACDGDDEDECLDDSYTCLEPNNTVCALGVNDFEQCGDGLDNDCDGSVDEGFICTPGETEPCTTGCGTDGTRTCDGECAWGLCEAPAESCNLADGEDTVEVCGGGDENCDGHVDEGVRNACGGCAPLDHAVGEACDGHDSDTCNDDAYTCAGIDATVCGEGPGEIEVCDGVDNDCDGLVDEEIGTQTCGAAECATAVPACVDGTVAACPPPGEEIQVFADDFNDGTLPPWQSEIHVWASALIGIDLAGGPEGSPAVVVRNNELQEFYQVQCEVVRDHTLLIPGRTYCLDADVRSETVRWIIFQMLRHEDPYEDGGLWHEILVGPSWSHVRVCFVAADIPEGHWRLTLHVGSDTPTVWMDNVRLSLAACEPCSQTTETCNGADDDCDGDVDEGLPPETVACGVGACEHVGTRACVGGVWTETCTESPARSDDDTTCDGVDDDCDGAVDEDLGRTPACGVGLCERTMEACINGVTQTCTPGPARTEDCSNAVDDDCDGGADCRDSDCAWTAACPAEHTITLDFLEMAPGMSCEFSSDFVPRTWIASNEGSPISTAFEAVPDGLYRFNAWCAGRWLCDEPNYPGNVRTAYGAPTVTIDGRPAEAFAAHDPRMGYLYEGAADWGCNWFLCVGRDSCEFCGSGIDDDGDGFVDCEDPDCLWEPMGLCEYEPMVVRSPGPGLIDFSAAYFPPGEPCITMYGDLPAMEWGEDGLHPVVGTLTPDGYFRWVFPEESVQWLRTPDELVVMGRRGFYEFTAKTCDRSEWPQYGHLEGTGRGGPYFWCGPLGCVAATGVQESGTADFVPLGNQ